MGWNDGWGADAGFGISETTKGLNDALGALDWADARTYAPGEFGGANLQDSFDRAQALGYDSGGWGNADRGQGLLDADPGTIGRYNPTLGSMGLLDPTPIAGQQPTLQAPTQLDLNPNPVMPNAVAPLNNVPTIAGAVAPGFGAGVFSQAPMDDAKRTLAQAMTQDRTTKSLAAERQAKIDSITSQAPAPQEQSGGFFSSLGNLLGLGGWGNSTPATPAAPNYPTTAAGWGIGDPQQDSMYGRSPKTNGAANSLALGLRGEAQQIAAREQGQTQYADAGTTVPTPRERPAEFSQPAQVADAGTYDPSAPQPRARPATFDSPTPTQVAARTNPTGMTLEMDKAIDAASRKYNVPRSVIEAQITQESTWNPKALSNKGAVGLMGVMPSTARQPGYGVSPVDPSRLTDPATNIDFGTHYLAARAPNTDWSDPKSLAEGLGRYNPGSPTYASEVTRHMPGGGPTAYAGADSRAPAEQAAVDAVTPGGYPTPRERPAEFGASPQTAGSEGDSGFSWGKTIGAVGGGLLGGAVGGLPGGFAGAWAGGKIGQAIGDNISGAGGSSEIAAPAAASPSLGLSSAQSVLAGGFGPQAYDSRVGGGDGTQGQRAAAEQQAFDAYLKAEQAKKDKEKAAATAQLAAVTPATSGQIHDPLRNTWYG